MFKKAISLVLVLCLTLALCACAGGTTSSTTPTPSKDTPASSAAASEGEKLSYPVVSSPITVKGVVVALDMTYPRTVWQDVEKVTGVKFEFENIEKDASAVYIAAGNWPDFFHCSMDNSQINDYGITGKKFANYKDYLDLMPNLQQTFKDYPQAQKAVTETNGAIYQLPYIEESATVGQARVYYREDVLKAAGQKVPTTTEEFYNVLKALKDYNDGAAPLVCGINETNYVGSALYSAFGPETNSDFEEDSNKKVQYNRLGDQYRHYLSYINKLYKEGLLHQEYLTLDGATQKSLAQAGKTVFMDGTAGHSLTEKDFASGTVELNVLAPLTSEYDSERVYVGQLPINTGAGFFINAESKYIKELARCFDIMYATEEVAPGTGLYGESFCYGNQGVTWDYSNADKTEYKFIQPDSWTDSFTNYQYKCVIYTNAGRATALKGCVTSTPGNNQARQKGFVANMQPYMDKDPFPTKFLKFDEDEQTTITDNYTDIKKYVDEMHDKFISGVEDVNNDTTWNTYCKRIEDMHIDEVLKVYQASYDRWLAS